MKVQEKRRLKKEEINFEVGDLVLVQLRKQRFPKKKYNKLKLKKVGPCKISRKFSSNAYGIELAYDIGISPIFNVSNLYPFMVEANLRNAPELDNDKIINWEQQLPKGQN